MCNIVFTCQALSSPLLLRIPPNFFDYSGSSSMCLSSLNRSICKVFRHIMPNSAPLCKALHYSKTGVPWQMNKTFIIVINLLVLPWNTLFYEGFRVFVKRVLSLSSWQNKARWSKLWLLVSSKIGSKTKILTTKDFCDISSLYFRNHILGSFLVSYKLPHHGPAANNSHTTFPLTA